MHGHTHKSKQTCSTVAAHTHTGIFMRCCQLPRWCIGSCSCSFNTGSIIRRKIVCPKPEPGSTLEPQASMSREKSLTGLKQIRASQEKKKSAASKKNLHYGLFKHLKNQTVSSGKCLKKQWYSCTNASDTPNNDDSNMSKKKSCAFCQKIYKITSESIWKIFQMYN